MTDKQQLISMGFDEKIVDTALKATKNAGLQPAIDWMLANPDGIEEINQDEEEGEISVEQQTAKSLICDDCGKILRDGDAAQFHAVKTNHSNFSESLKEVAKLTPEEKAAKIKELEVRLAARREEKRLLAIQESKQKESIRRTTGAEMQIIREKLEQENMAKEATLRKKQKEEDRKAIIAVRKQLEADKKERQREAEERKMAAQGTPIPMTPVSKPVIQDVNYTESRIQIRIPNMAPISKVFNASDPLESVFKFCRDNYAGDFKLFQTFPRKSLEDLDRSKSLKDLNFVPSAAFVLQ